MGSEPRLHQPRHDTPLVNAIGPEWAHDFSWANQTNGTTIYPMVPTSCRPGSTLLSVPTGVPHLIVRRAGQDNVDIVNYGGMTLNLNHTHNLLYHRAAWHKKTFFTI